MIYRIGLEIYRHRCLPVLHPLLTQRFDGPPIHRTGQSQFSSDFRTRSRARRVARCSGSLSWQDPTHMPHTLFDLDTESSRTSCPTRSDATILGTKKWTTSWRTRWIGAIEVRWIFLFTVRWQRPSASGFRASHHRVRLRYPGRRGEPGQFRLYCCARCRISRGWGILSRDLYGD